MCNACHNVCCGSDMFGGCGCDHCECEECWTDDNFEEDCAEIADRIANLPVTPERK